MTSHRSNVREHEQGMALILALFLTVFAIGLVVSGSTFLKAHRTKTETNYALHGQALQFARSGLIEAQNWFRRQTTQPVTDFEPVRDITVSPRILDTDDPDIGLVRDFQIAGQVWGRYEVWKEWAGDPDADRLAWRQKLEATDVTSERVLGTPGSAWRLRCIGYVYNRVDPTVAFDVPPNQVRAQEVLETEIQRLSLSLPGVAALNIGDGNSAHINTMGRIIGNSAGGISYPQGSGTPNVGPLRDNRVTGTPGLAPVPGFDDSTEAVFGVTYEQLRAMADVIVTQPGDFPVPVGGQLVVVETKNRMDFDATTPLDGTGMVYVKGNAIVAQGSNSNFSGVLYVDGNLTVREPAELRGAAVVTGNITVQGSSSYATIRYDSGAISAALNSLGQYRVSGAIRKVVPR